MRRFSMIFMAMVTAISGFAVAPANADVTPIVINTSTKSWQAITASNDGTNIAAAATQDGIYISTDSGSTWVNRTSSLSPQPSWNEIVSSADGRYLAASAYVFGTWVGGVYISSDFGETWDKVITPAQGGIESLAMSSDGSKIIAAVSNGGGNDGIIPIYRSSDYGVTWTNTNSGVPGVAVAGNFFELTISDDGVNLAATFDGGAGSGLILSSNSGTSWTQVVSEIPSGVGRIAASADGSKLAYKVFGNPLYFSTNFGANWTTSSWATSGSYDLSMSGDGNVVVVLTTGSLDLSTNGGASVTSNALTFMGFMERWNMYTNRTGTKVYLAKRSGSIRRIDIGPTFTAPNAPTIGTAIALSPTSASISFTEPTSNGGAEIETYTATSTPGTIMGTLLQSGSGSITVTGLTASTAYTFRITASNSVGTSSASSATVSITMPASAEELAAQNAAQAAAKAAADLAAQKAAEAKREAEKKAARVEILESFAESTLPTLVQFNTAEIYGVTKKNIDFIISDVNNIIIDESATALNIIQSVNNVIRDESATALIQNLPIKPVVNLSMNTIFVVEKVVKKYVILDSICQPGKFSYFFASELTSVGLIPKKYQTIITYKLRNLALDQRNDYSKINSIIGGEIERFQKRDKRLAALLALRKSRQSA